MSSVNDDSTSVAECREAQARETLRQAEQHPHTSLIEKLESTLDSTVGAGTSDKVAGRAKELLGKAEERMGEVLGNRETQARGIVHQVDGKTQQSVGELKEEAEKTLERAKELRDEVAAAAKKLIL